MRANSAFAAPLRRGVQVKGRNTCDPEIPAEDAEGVPRNTTILQQHDRQPSHPCLLLQSLLVAKHLWCLLHLSNEPEPLVNSRDVRIIVFFGKIRNMPILSNSHFPILISADTDVDIWVIFYSKLIWLV